MSCNNYTTTQIPVSVGFDANGNAGSLIETKQIKVTKIETPTDADQLIIAAANDVIFEGNIVVQGSVQATQGVTITGASSISGMSDTLISTPIADNEVLAWDSTAGKWINQTASEAGLVVPGDLSLYATTASLVNYATTGSLNNYATTASLTGYLTTASINNTVQAWDVALDALSLVTPAADRLPYFTGANAAQITQFTNTARTLLDDNSIGAMQQTLGVRPGIEVQTQNQNLQDIANIDTGFLVGNEVLAWDGANWTAVVAPGGSPVALNDITDVTISTAVDNDFLVYNGTNWVDEDPSVARTSLGATTVGANIFTLTNPTAVRYLKINADNSVSTRTAAEMRTDLTAQEQNSTLTNIATQTPAANTLIYFDGSTNAATTNLTSFGRSLLDDSTAAECRGTIGAQGSDVALDAISTLTDASGASAYGALLYTVPADNIYNSLPRILPVLLPDKVTISNNYGKILRFLDFDPPVGSIGFPQWSTLSLGELDNVDITGAGGNLTAGRILYVNTSQDLTELANPAGTSFLRHNGDITGPTWRTSTDVRTDIGLATTDSPQFAGINVGNAADTLIARSSAGNITVAGQTIYRAGGTDVPIADGGTGASTAAGARTNIFAGLSIAKGDLITYDGSDFTRIAAPTVDGTYSLQVVKSGSTFTFSWVGS